MSDDRHRKGPKPGPLPSRQSQVFSGKAGMMRLPDTVQNGRRSQPEPAQEPRSARSNWAPAKRTAPPKGNALAQTISISDTAVSAMPSESHDLAVLRDKDGPFASQIRLLATRIVEMRDRLGYTSYLVTSPDTGEGKTLTAANLALVMSEDSDRRVALVDANFRGPRAADLFNLDKRRGLKSIIAGDHALAGCVARVLGRNLIVLPAGGPHDNPASILSSPKFKSLITELAQAVDFMIIDAPPAIPHADVPLLSQSVDGVLMVSSANRTKRALLDRAVETIGDKRIVGTIFVERTMASLRKDSA